MPQRRGADGRFMIDGAFFACQRITIKIPQPLIETSNTEGVASDPLLLADPKLGSVSKLPDITGAEIECANATFADEDNPFLLPFGVGPGSYHLITFWPGGLAGPQYGPWHCAWAGSEHALLVPGGQPLTLRWETDGVDPAILGCFQA